MTYRLEIVSQSEALPFERELIAPHMRVLQDSDDTLVDHYIREALETLETDTRRFYRSTTVREYYDRHPLQFCRVWELHRVPVSSVDSIKYLDSDGDEQTWSADEYETDLVGRPARIVLADAGSVPAVKETVNAVYVNYTCSAATMPRQAIQAVLTRATCKYEHRELDANEQRLWYATIRNLIWGWG